MAGKHYSRASEYVCVCVCIWIDRKISTEVSKLQLTHLIRDFFLSNTIKRRYVSHACPLSPSLLSQDNIPTFSACMLFAFPPSHHCLFQLRQQWAPAGRFFKLFFTFFIWKCNKLENTLVWAADLCLFYLCEQLIFYLLSKLLKNQTNCFRWTRKFVFYTSKNIKKQTRQDVWYE